MSRFAQPFLTRVCLLFAYTSPRYQVSVYMTISPLVLCDVMIARSDARPLKTVSISIS